ncbi:hypothetical protein AncyloWKF20_07520 [Ancylobacter sp. WKF20]|uniref:hypothetical protein n=1 Tax=Ancylobacter sp. WKF20 TaxID=3039801 RepID=UPI0024343C5C|nr:hypothetical protein [Ancylobacter sp. WKF20]WGD31658.1 hypothetical protein AncyloWKF20_07520 [Ancylobacter sp. WKF20]
MDYFITGMAWLAFGLSIGLTAHFGMKRSFGKWFIYGFFLWPIAAIHLVVIGLFDKTGATAPKVAAAAIVLVCGVLTYLFLVFGTGFSEDDISEAQNAIRKEYEGRGVKVSDVVLIRESAKKLKGYVALEALGQKIMRSCVATMSDTSTSYIWECE